MAPFGKIGGEFVDILATLIQSFADETCAALQKVAWKAVTVACQLLLQRPNLNGTTGTQSQHLERRLSLCKSGNISELFAKASCIQSRLTSGIRKNNKGNQVFPTVFSQDWCFHRRYSARFGIIFEEFTGGVLRLDDHATLESKKKLFERFCWRKKSIPNQWSL